MKILKILLSIIFLGCLNPVSANDWSQPNLQSYLDKQLSCQLKIQKLQWSHTIWPEQNETPKPLFSDRVHLKTIKQNINDILVREQFLSEYHSTIISSEMLQKELDRIVRDSKNPNRLKQYFKLFDYDANSIVECLVRPIVVKNLWRNNSVTTKIYSSEIGLLHIPETTRYDYILPEVRSLSEGLEKNIQSQESDLWLSMNSADAPSSRFHHTAVWTGNKMIIWGGQTHPSNFSAVTQTGGMYDPVFDTWEDTNITASTPSARQAHTAIWTGTLMVIWGGHNGSNNVNTGGRFDPVLNSWSDTGTSNLIARQLHTAVWTGTNMIVWGGYGGGYLNSGGVYDPNLNTWSATSILQDVPDGRSDFTAIWTGQDMIIWSGNFLTNGGILNVDTNTWRTMSEANAPVSNQWHSAIWTGSEMIVWGGLNYQNTGGRYIVDGAWSATGSNGVPLGRQQHTAVWTGNSMIVWGGDTQFGLTETGGIYYPDEIIFANGFE